MKNQTLGFFVMLFVLGISDACASDTSSTSSEVSPAEAKDLVMSVANVKNEYERNSTCTDRDVTAPNPSCDYYLVQISCTPGKDDAGLLQIYAVNKKNGDVQTLGTNGRLLNESGLAKLQNKVRGKHKLTEADVSKNRDISMDGCLGY